MVAERWWQTGEMFPAAAFLVQGRGGGVVIHRGAIGLGRLRPDRAGECAEAMGAAVNAVREGLLLTNVVV